MAGEDVDFGSAHITVSLDGGNSDAEARRTGAQIQRALLNATRRIGEQLRRQIQRGLNAQAVTARVEPDLRRFDALLLNGLRSIDSLDIPVAPDVTGFVERLRALLADVEIPIRVVPDLDDFDRRIRTHNAPDVRVNANVNVDANRLTRALSGLGGVATKVGGVLAKGLKFGAMGIAAAGAAAGVGKFVAALAPAAGIMAAFPAAIAGFQAALGALKLALAGVGDAFEAALTGDSKAFEKSLENLSPKAQAAAREVRALKPAFESLRNSVQDGFFVQFEGQITATAKALQGPLKTGLTSIARAWGSAARGALGYVQGAQGVANVSSILTGTTSAVSGLAQTTNKLTAGLLQVAAVIAERFGPQLGGAISNLGQRFGTWLQQIAQGGQAVRWVDNAVTVFAQLGGILQNVGSILFGVWQAASGAGGGVLANIQQITKSFAQFVNSAKGQEAIGNVFGAVAQIAAQLGPILSALVTQIGAIAPALTPIFTALGPAIVNLINALGPGLAAIAPALATVGQALAQGLAILGPALGLLGAALAQILTALAPLLPLAGQLAAILAQALAPVLSAVAQALGPVISALVTALMPVLPILSQAFVTLVQALTPLAVGVGQALAQVLLQLAPLFPVIAQAVAQVVAAFAPLILQFTAALLPVLPGLIDAFMQVVFAVMPLIPSIVQLVAALTPLVGMIAGLAGPILQVAAAILQWTTLNVVVPVIKGVVTVLTELINGATSVVNFIVGLPGQITSGLSSLGSSISDAFSSAFEWVKQKVSEGVDAVVKSFTDLPGKITAALAALPGALLDAFTTAVAGVAIALLTILPPGSSSPSPNCQGRSPADWRRWARRC